MMSTTTKGMTNETPYVTVYMIRTTPNPKLTHEIDTFMHIFRIAVYRLFTFCRVLLFALRAAFNP